MSIKQDLSKLKWFKDARYGLFIHWGIYSILDGTYKGKYYESIGEWIMKHASIPIVEYEKLASEFNPVNFDAKEYVQLAKDAGMKYIAITAKHHDGFAMYHSKASKYNIVDATPWGRDPMKELAQEIKDEDIKLCFYYSQVQDWHERDGVGNDWDFDVDGYADKTLPGKRNFQKYIDEKVLPQLEELLTQYGDIGMIWFDTPIDCPLKYSKQIVDKVHSIQPNCLISGRIGNLMGDFVEMGDNNYPTKPLSCVWEVPGTINDTWSYKSRDTNWKSAKQIMENLIRTVGFGGNYLLNVGPDEKGIIPKDSADILREVGAWLRTNSDSVYGTDAGPEQLFTHDWGYITQKDNKLYFHILNRAKKLRIRGIINEVSNARLLSTGQEIKYIRRFPKAFKMPDLHLSIPDNIPNDLDIVIVMDFLGDKIQMANIETLY